MRSVSASWWLVLGMAAVCSTAAAQSADASPGPVIVVVESARASLEPEAVRQALSRALDASVVVLGEDERRPRALVAIAIRPDGGATAHVETRDGGKLSGSVAAAADQAGELDRLGREIATLVLTAEGQATSPGATRAGLIPWEPGGLRPYPPPQGAPSGALLPWPASAPISGGSRSEPGTGLSTPAPGGGPGDDDELGSDTEAVVDVSAGAEHGDELSRVVVGRGERQVALDVDAERERSVRQRIRELEADAPGRGERCARASDVRVEVDGLEADAGHRVDDRAVEEAIVEARARRVESRRSRSIDRLHVARVRDEIEPERELRRADREPEMELVRGRDVRQAVAEEEEPTDARACHDQAVRVVRIAVAATRVVQLRRPSRPRPSSEAESPAAPARRRAAAAATGALERSRDGDRARAS